MNIIRAKFERGEEVKYISHLDVIKVFERALRRASIPIAYSQGFNPHPHMVFGLPLSVGITSSSEYADFEINGEIAAIDFMSRLNEEMPKGFILNDAKIWGEKTNIMSSIGASSYDILVCTDAKVDINDINDKIAKYLSNREIKIEKESKGKKREVDIRPMIYEIVAKALDDSDVENIGSKRSCFCISVLLGAGSKENLKPDILFESITKEINIHIEVIKIHRTGLFIKKDNKIFHPLSENCDYQ